MSAPLLAVRRDEGEADNVDNNNNNNENNNNVLVNNENGDDLASSSSSSVVPLDDAPDVVAPPPAPAAPAAPTLRQNLARIWHAVGRKQVEVWRTGGAVRAVAYYALATSVVTGISWAVEQEHTCSVPVFEWLAAHVMVVLVRFVAAFAILYISRQAQLFERRRSLLGIVSRVTDASLLLLCVVGLSYVVSTASGDCPSSAPYQYRALALLVTFEALAMLLAMFVGGCMLAGGWAGGRGLRVPGFNFNGVAQQLESSNGRGATYEQIIALPLRRFVKSSAVAEKRDVPAAAVEAADAIEDLQPPKPAPAKAKRVDSDSDSVSSDEKSGGANENDDEDSEMSLTCAVCLGEYEAGELVRVLPCKHYFHRECIDTWLARNKTCPFCKHSIDEAPPAHAQAVHTTTMAETASTDAED